MSEDGYKINPLPERVRLAVDDNQLCYDCSALVMDMSEHLEWHERLQTNRRDHGDQIIYLKERMGVLQEENEWLRKKISELNKYANQPIDSLSRKYVRLEQTLRDLPDRITKECERVRAAYDPFTQNDYRQGIHAGGFTARNVVTNAIQEECD